MAFLTLSNGSTILTVRVKSDAAAEKYNEHGLDRERMFNGDMRQIRRGIYRQWDVTSGALIQSDSDALCALLESNILPLIATGDLVQSTDGVAVIPILTSNNPIQTADGWRRQVVFTLHETNQAFPVDTTAVPWLFLQRGIGYWNDDAKSVAAASGDDVRVWADQSGNGRDAVRNIVHDDRAPVREDDEVHFGVNNWDGMHTGGSQLFLPSMLSFASGEFMIGVRATYYPAPTDGRSSAWLFQSSDSGRSKYPNTSGHIIEGFGITTPQDCGDFGEDLRDFHVYNVTCDAATGVFTVRLDNVVKYTTTLGLGQSFQWTAISEANIGWGRDSGWDGKVRDVLITNAVLTTRQRASWFDYLRGATDEPPLPV